MKPSGTPRAGTPASDGDPQVLDKLREFYRFMVEQKLEALEYDHQGLRVRLVRRSQPSVQVPVHVPFQVSGANPPPSNAVAARAPAAAPALPPGASTVKAPMMGIFYRASSPSSPPFVKKGDVVKKGQVLCLIEAMKVFNEVKADFDCAVLELLLENGKPVKAGQDIYVVSR